MTDHNNPDLLAVLRELHEVSARLQRQSHELIDTVENSPLGRNVERMMRVVIDGTDERGTDSLRFIAHDNRRRLTALEKWVEGREIAETKRQEDREKEREAAKRIWIMGTIGYLFTAASLLLALLAFLKK